MAKFSVEIIETQSRIEAVEAGTWEEARDQVRQKYRSGDIILTADNSNVEVDFEKYEDTAVLDQPRGSRLTEQDENIIKDILKMLAKEPDFTAMLALKQNMTGEALDTWLDGVFIKLGNGRVTFEEHAG